MSESDHLAMIAEMLAEVGHPVTGYDDRGAVTLLELGLDSLTLLELLMLVDERIGVEIRVEQVPVETTLAELAALIDQQPAG